MPYVRQTPESALLQGVVIDLLAGAMSTRGDKGIVAHAAQIQLAALSRILNHGHMPSPPTAERLARALPLPYADQQYWLSLVREYWESRRAAKTQPAPPTDRYDHDAFLELRHRQAAVQHSSATGRFAVPYLSLYEDALAMIRSTSPYSLRTAHTYAYLCSVLNDCAQELGRRGEALLWARRGRIATQLIEVPRQDGEHRKLVLLNQVNSLRIEAAALNELNLHRTAVDLCIQAIYTEGFQADPGYWSLQVTRDQLKALAGIPRTRIWMVNNAVLTARRMSGSLTHPAAELLDMLLSCAAAEAYISLNKPAKALRELRRWTDRLPSIPLLGPVHAVQFHKNWGQAQAALKHHDEAQDALNTARSIARTAGLWSAMAKLGPE